jgi:hypothetical protein
MDTKWRTILDQNTSESKRGIGQTRTYDLALGSGSRIVLARTISQEDGNYLAARNYLAGAKKRNGRRPTEKNKKRGNPSPGPGPVAVSFVNGRAIAVPVKRCAQWAALCPYAVCPCPAGPASPGIFCAQPRHGVMPQSDGVRRGSCMWLHNGVNRPGVGYRACVRAEAQRQSCVPGIPWRIHKICLTRRASHTLPPPRSTSIFPFISSLRCPSALSETIRKFQIHKYKKLKQHGWIGAHTHWRFS